MLEVSQVLQCKQLAGQGESIRKIAKRMGISRNTVRSYLRGAAPGMYVQTETRAQPAQEAIRDRVRELLEEEKDKGPPRKQRLTAARIHRLLEKDEIEVSERTVRTVVADVRLALRDALAHAYLPLEYDPGIDAQVDFFSAEVDDINEGRSVVYVLLVRASYSGRTFRYAAPNQTREALFEGLTQAFEFFGGVFHHLWFDNLTPAVKKVLKGRDRETQKAFDSFQAHYGFKAEFCGPGKGNEKGGVELGVRVGRSAGFTPIPEVDGRPEIQKILDSTMEDDFDRKERGRELTIGQLWSHEQPHLLPLPPTKFDGAIPRVATVTKRSWIQCGTNFYSVPVEYVGSKVTVKMFAEEVVILDKRKEIARHPRSYGRYQTVLDLDHYLPLLMRKHRGLDRTIPMRRWLKAAPPCWQLFLEALREKHGEVDGSIQFLETVKLCSLHGLEKVTEAVESTLRSPWRSLAILRYYLGIEEESRKPKTEEIDYEGPKVVHGTAAEYAEVHHG